MAKFNGNTGKFTSAFKFNTEKEVEDIMSQANKGTKTEQTLDAGNEYGLTSREYIVNLILMTLLFTSFSFSFWLCDFQAEYLGTDMFIIFYANGVVCILTGPINLFLFKKLGLKTLLFCT